MSSQKKRDIETRDGEEANQEQQELTHGGPVVKTDDMKSPNEKQNNNNKEEKEEEEELEFEDPFGDDIEEEDLPEEGDEDEDEDEYNVEGEEEEESMEVESEKKKKTVWKPGTNLEENEVLEFDPSAYDMLHSFSAEWSCLTFDILRDNLGWDRKKFPHTLYLVTGTQASQAWKNSIYVLKISQLCKMENEDDEEDDDDEEMEDDPIIETQTIAHQGGINRIRAIPSHPHVVATWADTGRVNLWNISTQLKTLDMNANLSVFKNQPNKNPKKPIQVFKGHETEGFALDWSTTEEGRLVTGDCHSKIHLWNYNGSQWTVDETPYAAHEGSVEDLQWSPKEANVFASCSVDGTIKLWDVRMKTTAALSLKAHDCDVNVISWNRQTDFLLISGADDGSFNIWDLRNFKQGPQLARVAHFKWHSKAITSVEWHPTDAATLVVAGEDDQVTTWDMSLEKEEHDEKFKSSNAKVEFELPDQLLFCHLGQKQIKEVHWHPQIPGLLISTAYDGFNIYKSCNV